MDIALKLLYFGKKKILLVKQRERKYSIITHFFETLYALHLVYSGFILLNIKWTVHSIRIVTSLHSKSD